MNNIINKYAPLIEKQVSPKKIIKNPWITRGLLKSSRTLDSLYTNQKNKPINHPVIEKFKKYKQQYKKLKRTTKNTCYINQINNAKNDIRKTWQLLNNLVGKTKDKSSIPNHFIHNVLPTTNAKIIANGFCEYFT